MTHMKAAAACEGMKRACIDPGNCRMPACQQLYTLHLEPAQTVLIVSIDPSIAVSDYRAVAEWT